MFRDRRLSARPEPRPLLRILQCAIVDFARHGVDVSDLVSIHVNGNVFDRIVAEWKATPGVAYSEKRLGNMRAVCVAGVWIETEN